ncbi:MAG TPA: homoserine kinase, partial [Oculatellaceae cyanobacterium]
LEPALMITVCVPATIANMGPGFDSFGLAVSLCNEFRFQPDDVDNLSLDGRKSGEAITFGSDNILFQAMDRLFNKAGEARPRFSVVSHTQIPVARGLGSSSTAIIAGLVAANHLLGERYSETELLEIAVDMEGHPDNVAPALLGGVILYDEGVPYRLPWPNTWRILTVSPAYPVLTEEARRILPQQIRMDDAIFNLRKSSVLTYALLKEDPEALRTGLQDRLHQPYRRQLIREYDAIEKLALDAGALGMIISGSGSTMAIFYPEKHRSSFLETVQSAIMRDYPDMLLHDLTVDALGARIPVQV